MAVNVLTQRISETETAQSSSSVHYVLRSLCQCCVYIYRGADKSLARPGTKQAIATEDFDVHISYL